MTQLTYRQIQGGKAGCSPLSVQKSVVLDLHKCLWCGFCTRYSLSLCDKSAREI